MRLSLLSLLSLALLSCRHEPWVLSSAPRGPIEPRTHPVTSCSTFLAELDAMSLRELKAESDKVQKQLVDRKSEDNPRSSLIVGIYQARIKNYSRAIEFLSPLSNKKSFDESCRLSVKVVVDLLSDLSKLEKELVDETKQKLELERKLKALSDIEKEMSRREGRTKGF